MYVCVYARPFTRAHTRAHTQWRLKPGATRKSREGLGGAAADGCGARFEAPLTIHLAMQRTLATPDTGSFGGLGSSTRTGETSSHGLIRRIAERLLG